MKTFPELNGGTIDITDFEDRLVIIDFMAPWCEPCKDQIKILNTVNDNHDVQIITVNVDPNYNATFLANFAEQEGINWSFGHSPEAALQYQVTAIPTVLLVDREGVIRYRGFFTPLSQFEVLIQQYG